MHDLKTTVTSIERKVGQMIEVNERLLEEVEKTRNEKAALQEEINKNVILINKLKEENKILKLGNALTHKGDSAEIKLKINQLIRSIDKSLATLTTRE